MQDLKHLSRKKSFSLGFFSLPRSNRRRLKPESPLKGLRLPEGRKLQHLKNSLVFLAIVLALTPVFTLLFQKASVIGAGMRDLLASYRPSQVPAQASPKAPPPSIFESSSALLVSAVSEEGSEGMVAKDQKGSVYRYSIDAGLQKKIKNVMESYAVPYGAFVAVEPATGRILSMVSYSALDPSWGEKAMFSLYPMASLFKIITATAAIEARKITPDTVVEFRGNTYSENPRYWETSPGGKNNRMDVTLAMGKSVNPVYGRIAGDLAGKASVMASVEKFGFNQTLLPGIPVTPSRASDPSDQHALMRMGAGLDHDVRISPLHAALMMGALANGGRMMYPSLTDSVTGADGSVISKHESREIRRLVTEETAAALDRMLSTTVLNGTSKRAFHDNRGRPLLREMDIAAKTGSINGDDPKGFYSWFAAYAPRKNPRIALVAMVVNGAKWKIKASHVGEQALEAYFGR